MNQNLKNGKNRQTRHALAFSKVGMAGEQVLFSWLLAVTSRAKLFGVGVAVFLGICALMLVAQLYVVLPRSGLLPLSCHPQRSTGNLSVKTHNKSHPKVTHKGKHCSAS